ncbi:MAG: alpha/beta fold hydrolase [Bacteroidales bacterium]|nr:alpha/beta fold hydrolase [Bacteroidales bacterium]
MKRTTLLLTLCSLLAAATAQDTLRYGGRLHIDSANSLTLTLMQVTEADTTRFWLGSPDQTEELFPASKAHYEGDSLAISIKSLHATLRGRLTDGKFNGKFMQGLLVRPVAMQRFEGEKPYRRPQTPMAPYPYVTQEVVFRNPHTPYLFHGTVTRPDAPGRFPAVILVSGSGAQDRDETILGHKPFAVVADHLTRHGIVVLRYDDRGWGSTDTNLYAGTTADFAEDARHALETLRALPYVDKRRIGIVGHSEGGMIAEMLAADGAANFAVLMAAPAIGGKEVLETQIKKITGKEPDVSAYANDTTSMNGRWMNYFYHFQPKPYLRAMRRKRVPVLVLQGLNDCQVLPEPNLKAMRKHLKYKEAEIHAYDKLNHLFQPSTTGLPFEYGQIEETMSLDVLRDMASFINK